MTNKTVTVPVDEAKALIEELESMDVPDILLKQVKHLGKMANFLRRVIAAAPQQAQAGEVQTDMLTPLDKIPGYTDPIILGRYSVRDYHVAPSGEGPRAADWADKPHRLVYDLCRALLARAALQPQPQAGSLINEGSKAQAGEADSERIELICHAYESGFGHGEKQDGLIGPYFESDECNQAYTIGYEAGKDVGEERAAIAADRDRREGELERLTHERNTLAAAIRDAAVKAGICRADVDLTGPHLLMLCDDMADCISAAPVPAGLSEEQARLLKAAATHMQNHGALDAAEAIRALKTAKAEDKQ